jgi:O-antigen/teichoic acid export membrane protein
MLGLFSNPIAWAKRFMSTGHERSIKAKANIAASLAIKAASIAISLVMVPLTLNYLSPSKYGVWLTLSSMVMWISFFDIGFTQGLRNKFAIAKSTGENETARIYVSTTYFFVGLIFLIFGIVLLILNAFVDWDRLINVPASDAAEISNLALVIIIYFCLQFVFRIINTILIADQAPSQAALIDVVGQFISLVIIYCLTKYARPSLVYLGLAVGLSSLLVVVAANVVLFKGRYKQFSPSFRLVRLEYAKDIVQLGGKFFVLQVASIIQFQTGMFMIAYYFDTEQVAAYNVAYKYFFTLQMLNSIFLSPLWSGTTEAYSKSDHDWIRNAVRKYVYLSIPFLLLGVAMLLTADKVYDLWLGAGRMPISHSLSVLCWIFFSANMIGGPFVYVLNGISAIKIQFYSSFISATLFAVLSWYLIRVMNFGVEAILIASIVCSAYGYVIAPIQYYMIFIKKSKTAIWHQ